MTQQHAEGSIYASERLAAGYAFSRPAVHPHVVRSIAAHLAAVGAPCRSALDIGCGAGRSTEALCVLSPRVVGLEPVRTMLRHCREVAPAAGFVTGRAEQLPFADGSFDILAAAGSLNYADLGLFLPSAARVLTRGGTLVVYDFSAGRRLDADDSLDEWFAAFERRYPFPPGYEMDVRQIAFDEAGMRLEAYEELEVRLALDHDAYLAYALTETNVQLALNRGEREAEIRAWCAETLRPVFPNGPRDVLFAAYAAYVRRR